MYDVTTLQLLYSGKTKDVYELSNGNVLLQFTDNTTMNEQGNEDPGGNLKGEAVIGSGQACVRMTQHFFNLFEKAGIPTHLIAVDIANLQMEVKKVLPIGYDVALEGNPGLEWIGRFVATGSFVKKYGKYISDGYRFEHPYVHATLKDDERGDPYIDKETIHLFKLLNEEGYMISKFYTTTIANIMKHEFEKLGCELYDFKVEFGWNRTEKLILIDEIGPGSARVYKDGKKMEKIEIGNLFA
jgi:phosphoribosylaminoimidazole-succinocarboxamide synthase